VNKNKEFGSTKISPIYQSIHQFANPQVGSGAEDSSYFELLFDEILIHFIKFMDRYQAETSL